MTDSGIVTVIRGNDSWLTLSIKHRHYKRTPSTHTCNNKTHRRSAGFSNHNLVQQTSRKLRSNQFKMEPALRMGTKQTEPWRNRIVASKSKPTTLYTWRGWSTNPFRRINLLRIATHSDQNRPEKFLECSPSHQSQTDSFMPVARTAQTLSTNCYVTNCEHADQN